MMAPQNPAQFIMGAASGDGDGDLDLFLAIEFPGNRLLLNDGTRGFRDATEALPPPSARRDGIHVAIAGFDGDGHAELSLASRGGPNILVMCAKKGADQASSMPSVIVT